MSINIFRPVHLTERPPFDASSLFDSTEWFGLFFQDQVELPFNLHALAGFRYDNATVDNNTLNLTTSDDDRLSPRAGLLWRPPVVIALRSYTENFGASNSEFNTDGTILPPQTAQQWETGAKTEFWDGRLSATFAYFDLTRQNLLVPDPINPLRTITIGEAETRGVELDMAGEILPGWRIIGGLLLHAFCRDHERRRLRWRYWESR